MEHLRDFTDTEKTMYWDRNLTQGFRFPLSVSSYNCLYTRQYPSTILFSRATGMSRVPRAGTRISEQVRDLSLLHIVQTGYSFHQRGSTTFSLAVNYPGNETEHLLSTSVEVKNERSFTSTPIYAFMACIENFFTFSLS